MAFKPRIVRLYLDQECQDVLAALAEKAVDLSDQQIASMLLRSSLRAMKESGYKMTLPLKFALVDETEIPVVPSTCRI